MDKSAILEVIIKARDEASGVLNNVQKSLKQNEETFKSMARYGAIAFTGIATGIGLVVQKAANMEQTEVAFTTMLKSAEKAKNMMSELNDFAAKTPYEFEEIAKASKSLLAFGVPAETMKAQLQSIGDIASGVSAPIGQIAEIYGKAKVQGRLFAEDINQLTGRGIPIIQELAKQFKVSDEEVKKLVESGKVGFPNLETAFKSMTSSGGQFENMMKNQSETFNGMMSTMKDSISMTMVAIGQQFLPILKELIEKISPVLENMRQWVAENPKLTSGILMFAGALAGIVTVAGLVGLAMPVIIAAINPFTLAIAGTVAVLTMMSSEVNSVITYISSLWDTFSKSEVARFLKMIIDELVLTFKDLWLQFKDLWDIIEPVFLPLLKFLAIVVGGVVVAAITALSVVLLTVTKGISYLIALLRPLIEVLSDSLVWAFNTANSAAQIFMGWIDSIIHRIQQMIDLARQAVSAVAGLFGGGGGSAPSYGGARASGGSVYSGNYYLVGERGPEIFAPNATGQIIPNSGNGGTTINFTGNTFLGDDEVADRIGKSILNQLQFQVKV